MKDNYRKIIDASISLMSEKGYVGTSIQMIADIVGIKKASIFHHFNKKEEILLAILQETVPVTTYDLMVLANDDSLSSTEKIKKFIKIHLQSIKERGDILKIYLSESRHITNKKQYRQYMKSRKLYTNLVVQLVKGAKEENPDLFGRNDPEIVANGLLGMCNWSVFWYQGSRERPLDEVADQLFEMTRFSCSG